MGSSLYLSSVCRYVWLYQHHVDCTEYLEATRKTSQITTTCWQARQTNGDFMERNLLLSESQHLGCSSLDPAPAKLPSMTDMMQSSARPRPWYVSPTSPQKTLLSWRRARRGGVGGGGGGFAVKRLQRRLSLPILMRCKEDGKQSPRQVKRGQAALLYVLMSPWRA